ncbi:cytosolic endo-beta-N-acetylglucosaminidase isoform X2 [Amia ocellicauda]|uniref:cytosolic endo-beta-N-acetylglucosaminidase isoform X2 n=1 Tax=Amia ocellicauda TaxID=2972642 RepID=UPI00346423AF
MEDEVQGRKRQTSSFEGVDRKLRRSENSGIPSTFDLPVDSQVVSQVVQYEPPSPLSARHYDLDTTEPISFSLKTLEELLSWQASDADFFNVATVPLANRQPPLASSRPRTLICHDMMGGYQQDRFIQGAEAKTAYAFYHWDYIDIFTYFSHSLVTIPPVCWTNAAHKHGVSVQGTFITEWRDGAKVCESFLAGEEAYRAVADKLVQIADYYGFDGWLINIENTLSETAVKNTPSFLRYLTDQMHGRVAGSLVLWYDSVLENGELKWQNELNDKNRVFFRSCDGIFTNYNWTEQHLEGMASDGAEQLHNVYVGVDVFARGDVVGGKFETDKALSLIREHGFSAAIFAPGWVYECHDKTEFRQNQDKFWGLLSDYLPTHRVSLFPINTSFCQGFGKNFYCKGKVEEAKSWFHLSAQEMQPLYIDQKAERKEGGWVRTRGCPHDAWNGGSSLLVEGKIPSKHSTVSVRLFSVHVAIPRKTFVSFIYKLEDSPGVKVSLELKTINAPLCSYQGVEDIPSSSVQPELLTEDHGLVTQFRQSCGLWRSEGWVNRCYLLETEGCALWDILVNVYRGAQQEDDHFQCRIGEIKILDAESLTAAPVSVQSPSLSAVVWRRGVGSGVGYIQRLFLNATLSWHYPAPLPSHFRVYWRKLRSPGAPPSSGQEPRALIGRAYSTVYRVVELGVPDVEDSAPCWLEFLIQPVTREGFAVPESHWGRLVLKYTEPSPSQTASDGQ